MDALKDLLKPEILWFLIGISLLVLELLVPGLVIMFFGIGGCIVGLLCLLSAQVHDSLNAQLLTFIVSSLLSLLLLRKWVRSVFVGYVTGRKDTSEDLTDYVGEKAVVKTQITPISPGKVEFHGTNWRAEADQTIAEGTMVQIVGKDNITLKVKPS